MFMATGQNDAAVRSAPAKTAAKPPQRISCWLLILVPSLKRYGRLDLGVVANEFDCVAFRIVDVD
jgi:hypothetical protein